MEFLLCKNGSSLSGVLCWLRIQQQRRKHPDLFPFGDHSLGARWKQTAASQRREQWRILGGQLRVVRELGYG